VRVCVDGREEGGGVNVVRESANYERELILVALIVTGSDVCVYEREEGAKRNGKRSRQALPGSWRLGIQSPSRKSCFSPEWDFCTCAHTHTHTHTHTHMGREEVGVSLTHCAHM